MEDRTQRRRVYAALTFLEEPDAQALRDLRAAYEAQEDDSLSVADRAVLFATLRDADSFASGVRYLRRVVGPPLTLPVLKHYVTYYCPGTFTDETETREVESCDVAAAVRDAVTVDVRYGARPYCFRFTTCDEPEPIIRGGREFRAAPLVVAESGAHFLGARVLTLADVERLNAEELGRHEVLVANMRNNGVARVALTTSPYLHAAPFKDGDVNLDSVTGEPLPV